MKKFNKYDLTDSELKRAYDFINAVYLKHHYDSQNISTNNSVKKAVKIQDFTSQTRSISIKEDIQETPKRKVVSQVIRQEPVENKTRSVEVPTPNTKPVQKKHLSFKVRLLVPDMRKGSKGYLVPLRMYENTIGYHCMLRVEGIDVNTKEKRYPHQHVFKRNIELNEDSIITILKEDVLSLLNLEGYRLGRDKDTLNQLKRENNLSDDHIKKLIWDDKVHKIIGLYSLLKLEIIDEKKGFIAYKTNDYFEHKFTNNQTPEIIDIILERI